MNFKVLLLGDGKVGKTTLRKQYMGETLDEDYLMTMGTEFNIKPTNVNNIPVKLQIWDVAGQKLFTKVRKKYYRNASGILILFDLDNPDSFRSIPNWLQEYLDANENRIVPIIIIGNKLDLVEDDRTIDQQIIEEKMNKLSEWVHAVNPDRKVRYIETSALYDVNVNYAFKKLAEYMIEVRSPDIIEA